METLILAISHIRCKGKISFKKLKRVAKELGENMTDKQLQKMIDVADTDKDGEVSQEEFISIMQKKSALLDALPKI